MSKPRFHRDSIYGDGTRVRRTVGERKLILFKARLMRAAGLLTAASVELVRVMTDMLGADGRLDPSVETLMKLTGYGRTAVREGLDRLERFGFLSWVRRLVRIGSRCEQTTNAYILHVPTPESGFQTGVRKNLISTCARAGRMAAKSIRLLPSIVLDRLKAEYAGLPDAILQQRLDFEARQYALAAG